MPSDSQPSTPSAAISVRVRPTIVVILALAAGFLLRLATLPQVFAQGRIWLDGPDAYYHLRRAWLTLANWPWTPQLDPLVGVPEGGPISWPPVFDLLLATLALPWGSGSTTSLETLGALLPPVLGLLEMALLCWVVHRLFGSRAAVWATVFAAFLPGIARYSLLGALDHDPLIEAFALLALAGLAGAIGRRRLALGDVALMALGQIFLVLTWAGSILHLGLLCALTFAIVVGPTGGSQRRAVPALTLGIGSLIAAAATLPWVFGSIWTERMGATFIGLSWLHTAALLATALLGLGLGWWRRSETGGRLARLALVLMAPTVLGLGLLAVIVWPALRDGLVFFGRGEPFLQSVTESRPLLSLLGGFDLRAPAVRLSLLPFLMPLLLPWTMRAGRGDGRLLLLWVWIAYTLALALVQARYAHMAALPIAALAGFLCANAGRLLPRRSSTAIAIIVAALVLAPSLPAYVRLPGFASFHMLGRVPPVKLSGMDEVCDYFLEQVEPSSAWTDIGRPSDSAVLAPWSFGHWLIWRGHQGAISTPLGPQGQPAFTDGVRFYLLRDHEEARQLLRRRRIRHIVVQAEIPPLAGYASLSGTEAGEFIAVDPASGAQVLRADAYLDTLAARLAWTGTGEVTRFGRTYPALEGFREVFRGSRIRRSPLFGDVPWIRVYEVLSPERLATPSLNPDSDPAAVDVR